nr:MAG TPA: Bifunctional DNA primase polymerase [Caudoviricetes sp.]
MIVEYGGVQNNTFRRNIFGEQNDENIINSFESDTYCTIYKYDNENIDSCNFIAPLYLDLDIDNIEEDYNKLIRDLKILIHKLITEFHVEQNDIQIYFSGSKGFHLIISENIFGFEPGRTLNKDLKKVAVYLKAYTLTKCIDTKIYDYKRLFRINNTINSKTGLYKVRVLYNDLINMSYDELIDYASKPKDIESDDYLYNDKANESFTNLIEKLNKRDREKINIQVAKEYIRKKELLPCVKYILQNGSPNGQRNNSTIALANSLFQVGYNQDEVIEIITTWNETKNEEPLPDREIRATIKSAYNNSKQNIYYGCSSFRELDVCVKGCPIYKR